MLRIIIVLILLFIFSCIKDPTSLDHNNKYMIAFRHHHNIWLINEDGNNPRLLNTNANFEQMHKWSPDGKQIAFTSAPEGHYEIFLVDSSGANLRQITNKPGYNTYYYDWSIDGNYFVYNPVDESGNSGLFVVDIEGTNSRKIAIEETKIIKPIFSPVDNRIAFWTMKGTTNINYNLFLINFDGSNLIQLTEDLTSSSCVMEFSSDGERIAYIAKNGDNRQLFLLDINSKKIRCLTDEESVLTYPIYFNQPGKKLIYVASVAGKSNIFSINLDGSERKELADGRFYNFFPSISTDGRITFISNREEGSQIFIMNNDGTNVKQVTNFLGWTSEPVWCPRPIDPK